VNALYFNIVRAIVGVFASLALALIPIIMIRWTIKMKRFLFFDNLP